MAPPLSHYEGESAYTKDSGQIWDAIKSEVEKLYNQKGLSHVITTIEEKYGFVRKPRIWKKMLGEWGIKKNIPASVIQIIQAKEKKRKQEGKDTTFFYRNDQISRERIEKFKKRKMIEVSPDVATPNDMTYNTPCITSESTLLEEFHEEPVLIPSWPTYAPSLSTSHSDPVVSATKTDVPELGFSSMHYHFSTVIQPWPLENRFSHHGSDDTELSTHRPLRAELIKIWNTFEENDFTYSDKNGDPISEVFILRRARAKHQDTYGEFAMETLKQEFELAKAADKIGSHEEAKYYCRRILSRGSDYDVESFLRTILLNKSHLEESTFNLFCVLTKYIVQIGHSSPEVIQESFARIETFYALLMHQSEQNWDYLTSCMNIMRNIIWTAVSEGTVGEISAQVFMHGFRLAHECSVLGLNDAAKYMYDALSKRYSSYLDTAAHARGIAIAYRQYGLLLKSQRRWTDSAEKLLLACKIATNLEAVESFILMSNLEKDYEILLPHLTSAANKDDSLSAKIREILIQDRHQRASHTQDIPEAVPVSQIEQSSLSEFPSRLYFEPLPWPNIAEFNWTWVKSDGSTKSLSTCVSHKYGTTFTGSEITGISDPVAFVLARGF